MEQNADLKLKFSWMKKGKKYKAKYLQAYFELYGDKNGKDGQKSTNGGPGTSSPGDVVEGKGD